MSEYTVKYINRRARTDAAGFIRDCEEHYHRQIHMAADEIVYTGKTMKSSCR